jgi:TolB-like protein
MIDFKTAQEQSKHSKASIGKQLQKIISDPIFQDSEILKRFLSYIVNETLNEHSNQLKEYTIAVNVLDKPATFRPQDSGIVRIHAGRLRRALHYYYSGHGLLDEIRISIPKGSYVPVFTDNDEIDSMIGRPTQKTIIVGVAPFTQTPNNYLRYSFADGLGAQLSTSLMRIHNFSVVAYYAMKNLFAKPVSFEEINKAVGAQFIITGNIQAVKGCLRIHLQMSRLRTGQLVWSQMFEKDFSPEHIFEVQDEIVKLAVTEVEGLAF